MALAVIAQVAVAREMLLAGLVGLAVAIGYTVAGVRSTDPTDAPVAPDPASAAPVRAHLAYAAALAAALAFVFSSDNRFTWLNTTCWLAAIGLWIAAFAQLPAGRPPLAGLRSFVRNQRFTLLLLGLVLLGGACFRFAWLFSNPLDMNSDQAEKLLDIHDLLAGEYAIFFERNTGREPWQFYWTLGLIRLFGLPPDFMSLKIGTALIGWLMLPAVFLLAREIFGTRTALLATLFAAVASWGVITARFGLRYPLAPCAVAWTLFFLVRGLRRGERNALLAAGLWMGIGLQGYTAYRFMIVVVPLLGGAWLVWLSFQRHYPLVRRLLLDGALAAALALITLVPLLRYGVGQPGQLFYRAATRLTSAETAIPGEPLLIFLDNLRNVLLMFNYTSDRVWVANLPGQPAMDVVLGGLLVVGVVATIALSLRRRDPWPALILAAGLLMLLPSALSIAFPQENPSVVRTGGALPVLMIVCAVVPGLVIEHALHGGRRLQPALVTAAVSLLVGLVVALNYQRVFVAYPAQYCPRAQNAYDIANAMDAFVAAGGDRANAWIVGYPHWVDTRAVGIWIGDIGLPNTVIGPKEAAAVDLNGQPGWFALNVADQAALATLQTRYPQGQARVVSGSQCAGREFVVFEVP